MSSSPSLYRVSIAGTTGPAPANGFIDSIRAEKYLAAPVGRDGVNEASLDNLPLSFTFEAALAKRRANLRYTDIVAQLGFIGNMYISNINAPGADASTEASSFTFDVLIEHGDGSLVTWDETALPAKVLLTNPQTVIKRAISRALIQTLVVQADILDPTPTTTFGVYGATTSVPRYGVRYEKLAVAQLYSTLAAASATVTVTPLVQPST